MNKLKKWLSPVMFCLFLFSFAVLLILSPGKEYSEKEKRYLETAPAVSWETIMDGSFQDQLEKWVADQFPGRDLWVGIHAYANLLVGKNAQQEIYFAGDGYLISAPATDDLATFETALSRFDSFAEKTGLPATFIMVPSTGWIKDDLLPVGHKAYPDDQMFRRATELAEYLSVVDLRDMLKTADLQAPVAYRTDHHLTSFGNYTLYRGWRDALGRTALSQESYEIEVVEGFRGTTWSGSGYWLTAADRIELWDSGADVTVTITDGGEENVVSEGLFFRSHLDELDKYPVFLDGNHALTTIQNPNAQEGTLLVIKDSYAHGFATFLADHYQTIYLLDLRYYRGKISEFAAENGVDELLFLYGTSTLLTDTNSAWLF